MSEYKVLFVTLMSCNCSANNGGLNVCTVVFLYTPLETWCIAIILTCSEKHVHFPLHMYVLMVIFIKIISNLPKNHGRISIIYVRLSTWHRYAHIGGQMINFRYCLIKAGLIKPVCEQTTVGHSETSLQAQCISHFHLEPPVLHVYILPTGYAMQFIPYQT